MSNSTSKFTYPVAQREGSPVTPDKVQRGDRYLSCLGCYKPMIVRKGEVKVWHFAHKQVGPCNVETALHNGAKLAIKQRFDKAKEEDDILCHYSYRSHTISARGEV